MVSSSLHAQNRKANAQSNRTKVDVIYNVEDCNNIVNCSIVNFKLDFNTLNDLKVVNLNFYTKNGLIKKKLLYECLENACYLSGEGNKYEFFRYNLDFSLELDLPKADLQKITIDIES